MGAVVALDRLLETRRVWRGRQRSEPVAEQPTGHAALDALLDAGAAIDAGDAAGRRPLHHAAAAGARAATEAQWLMHRARARVRSTRLDPSFPTMYGSGGRAHRLVPHFSAPRVQVSSD